MRRLLVVLLLAYAFLGLQAQDHTVTLSVNPADAGTTSGAGTFATGTEVTVSASPAAGYQFVNWTESGVQVSATASYTFTIEADRALVANFSLLQYSISVSPSPAEGGSVSGGGDYSHGEEVTLTAQPASGYSFVNWTEGGTEVSSSSTYSFTATSSRNLVANFSTQSYTVSVSNSPSSGGTVTGGGNYNHGEQATITASPATGYAFVNWTEGGSIISTNASYTFTVNSNRSFQANYSQNTYTVNVSNNPSSGGTATGGGNYNHGEQATITASPATGYAFVNWTEGGSIISTNASYTFTVNSNRSFQANYSQNTYTVNVSNNPSSGGTATGGGNYNHGEQATITASPATGYAFVNWTEGGSIISTNSSYTFTVNSNRSFQANYSQNTYTVSVSNSPSSGGTATGGGNYNHGAQATITASPSAGYAFVNWTEGGSVVSTNASYTFTVNSNRSFQANYSQNTYTVSVSNSPSSGGTATGGGNYNHGAQATITASPSAGYAFVNWTEGGSVVSTNASYTFTVNSNRSFQANYSQNTYTVSVSNSPSSGGTATGGGNYNHGAQATITASPSAGYAFVNWTEGGSVVSTNASYTFTVNSNRSFQANYSQNTYTVSVSNSPSSGGTATGGGNYTHGSQATITASPSAGYSFVNWTEGGSFVSTNPNYTFTVNSNRSFQANYSLNSYRVSVSNSPTSGGTATGGGDFTHGSQATVSANPSAGYSFVNWTEGGSFVSANPNYTFTVTADRTFVANFSQIVYNVSITSSPTSGGTTNGAGPYGSGSTANIIATPATGYRFVNWTRNGAIVSTSANYSFTVTGNTTLVANFAVASYTITTSVNPAGTGTATGGGSFDHGATVTVRATPASGYQFTNWTENGTEVSRTANYVFTATGNRNLRANFSQIPRLLSLTGPSGTALNNNDVLDLENSDGGSLVITVSANADWTVAENSLWFSAVKESDTRLRLNYMDNISVVDKEDPLHVTTAMGAQMRIIIRQRARVSQISLSGFGKTELYPNPAGDKTLLRFAEEHKGKIRISIMSFQGIPVKTEEYNDIQADQTIELDLATVPSGQYLMLISGENGHKALQLIKL